MPPTPGAAVTFRAMADESTQSITIAAPASDVLGVIADFDSYPEWADSITAATVLTHDDEGRPEQVRFNLDAGPIKDNYVLAYDWVDDGVTWDLVSGQMQRQQRGRYRLAEAGDRTEVTYTLSVDLAVPLPGLLKRRAEKRIMDQALTGLKRRVEG
ncbi:SRPBCC family protein [Actinomycetospora straminea]|uniref:SRPBCC family protein n=2 Tax=Actinomycetospora straminea TaxID=663607 RepID=A0ABP9EZ07_9PSEU